VDQALEYRIKVTRGQFVTRIQGFGANRVNSGAQSDIDTAAMARIFRRDNTFMSRLP
jgi:hypothetical protein